MVDHLAQARSSVRGAANGFGRGRCSLNLKKEEKWSGCCDCKRAAGKPDGAKGRTDGEILFCTYYESDGGRSVCEQGGGPTGLGLSILDSI